ncbi:uncharacterized protein LOC119110366, partial [Pollicipes pollicipes]|uniref:uncharacterized protein LOC119110366 n=1 Tax=Pollicipes pollicipes TaxID=41117 RepID=UPI001884ED5A
MKLLIIVAVLKGVIFCSAQLFQDEDRRDSGMPQEKLFSHAEGIKLGKETVSNRKFLERKVLPVENWHPPNRDVDELYFNNKALQYLNHGLLKINGFTDTDVIMMNRWNGVERAESLWEADMILLAKQKAMYTKRGTVYGNSARLMPNFSEPWPGGEVPFFFENEGPLELFGDLQTAMEIWEQSIGCIKFKLAEDMANFSQPQSHRRSIPTPGADGETQDDESAELASKEHRSTPLPGGAGSSVSPPASTLWEAAHLLRVTVGEGCYATVGWRPWSRLVISERCSLGVLVHLLGHVLGLPHEHSRPDRVFRLHVRHENVRTRDFLFLNTESGGAHCTNDSAGGWYDPLSVMHLDPYGLTTNNLSTMTDRHFPATSRLGVNWLRPSYNDVLRLQQAGAYACPPADVEGCNTSATCVGHVLPDCTCAQPVECAGRASRLGGCSA